MPENQTEIKILPAYNGDSILIKTFDENQEEFIILIDGGTPSTFEYSLKKHLKGVVKIDLLVLTHIDNDHIGGLIRLFKNSLISEIKIGEIWYNQPDVEFFEPKPEKVLISVPQAEDWKTLIREKKKDVIIKEITTDNKTLNIKGLEFTILSPTQEIKNKLYEVWLKERNKSNKKTEKSLISTSTTIYSRSLEELNEIDFNSINTDFVIDY